MALTTTQVVIMAVAQMATAAISASMAPKPSAMPDNSAFLRDQSVQAKKAADTSSTDQIKAAKRAGGAGAAQQPTLLSGGVSDEELNTGTTILA